MADLALRQDRVMGMGFAWLMHHHFSQAHVVRLSYTRWHVAHYMSDTDTRPLTYLITPGGVFQDGKCLWEPTPVSEQPPPSSVASVEKRVERIEAALDATLGAPSTEQVFTSISRARRLWSEGRR